MQTLNASFVLISGVENLECSDNPDVRQGRYLNPNLLMQAYRPTKIHVYRCAFFDKISPYPLLQSSCCLSLTPSHSFCVDHRCFGCAIYILSAPSKQPRSTSNGKQAALKAPSMHINALLFAALLPSVALAYGYPTGSGVAFPTGGGNHTR
jgi:hypothetical protein